MYNYIYIIIDIYNNTGVYKYMLIFMRYNETFIANLTPLHYVAHKCFCLF